MTISRKIWTPGSEWSEEFLLATRKKYRLRRADRYTTLCICAADQLLQGMTLPSDSALITASAFGPSATSFQTVMDILDVPAEEISPTTFSHSVHNAAAAYLGIALDLHGPTYALTGFHPDLRENALALAESLVTLHRAPYALVIAVEAQSIVTDAAHPCYSDKFPASLQETLFAALISL